MNANCKTSCHLTITIQQAISTSHDISLAVVITSSIIQCSYDMHQDILSMNTLIKNDKKNGVHLPPYWQLLVMFPFTDDGEIFPLRKEIDFTRQV